MRISVVVATCGDSAWQDLAAARALPSANRARPDQIVAHHLADGTVSAARNAAAAYATSDWLCFLDADDELSEGYLDAMRSAFLHGAITTDWSPLLVPAVQYVRHGGWTRTESGTRPLRDRFSTPTIPNRGGWPAVNECVVGTLVRREMFERLGGFREWPSIEDWDLWLRCFDAGARLVYVEDAVYRAHVAPDGGRNHDQSCYPLIWAEHLARVGS